MENEDYNSRVVKIFPLSSAFSPRKVLFLFARGQILSLMAMLLKGGLHLVPTCE
jgi:hypothetical protein